MRYILLVCAAVLVGCHKASPIVGSWQAPYELRGKTGTHVVTLTEDGKYVSRAQVDSITAVDSGTWKLDGPTLTIRVEDVDWQFAGNPAGVDRANQYFQANKAKIIAGSNKHPTMQLTWAGNDQFTTKDETGKAETFTRIKN